MPTYKTGTVPPCPHCGKTLEDPIEDFSVPGRIGPASRTRTDCGYCDGAVQVEQVDKDTYELKAVAGSA